MAMFARMILIVALLGLLSACAGKNPKSTRVKCPACGYEFEVDQNSH